MTKTGVEYADDQITIYPSCPFMCDYCWAQTPLMRYRIRNPKPVEEAKRYAQSKKWRSIVVSFTTDPYQPREKEERLTRGVLEVLLSNPHNDVLILTKSKLVERDFGLLRQYDNVMVGFTVTGLTKVEHEPFAPPNPVRIETLRKADEEGIPTWMSIEPWIPNVTNPIEIIQKTHEFVSWYVIGKLNYAKRFGYTIPKGYYQRELPKVTEFCEQLGINYLIKKELKTRLRVDAFV